MTEPSKQDLPQIFDEDPRGKHDVAAELVDIALEEAPENALPSSSMRHVALAVEMRDDDISDAAFELAVGTVDQAIREGRV
jgi:hypothetical protein